jgi:hypothetical protein
VSLHWTLGPSVEMSLRRSVLAAPLLAVLAGPAFAAPPDFSGSWRLDHARSDDAKTRIEEVTGSGQVSGGTSPLTILPVPGTRSGVERVELRDWLLSIAGQLDRFDVEQTASEIKLYHGDNISRIFYFGRESTREDGQGRKLKCRIRWKGEQLVLEEEGDKGRKMLEMLTLVPSAGLLIQTVRWEDSLLKKPLELRLVYVRAAAGGATP